MLGELYKPRGLARETAQAVLEVEEPYACNVALGCPNGCKYCYIHKILRCSREECRKMRFPKRPPKELVEEQLERARLPKLPDGVFLSFLTDPFVYENKNNTEELIELLLFDWEIPVATCSKMNRSIFAGPRHGVTLVSMDCKFWQKYESNAMSPKGRLLALRDAYGNSAGYTWISMEPYPCSAIWKQPLEPLLEEIKFANLIIFGKWNYDKRANTDQAKQEYADDIHILRDFCRSNGIRLHVKSDTLKFALGAESHHKTE
jgi:DNA repair photolyase